MGAINELDVESIKAVNYSTIDTTIGNDVSNRLTELETNKVDKTYVDEQLANVSVDLSDYQTKTDATLGTTNKTIIGAINELETTKIEAKDYNVEIDYIVEGTTVDISDYQTKSDSTLTTTDKTIIGAINELDTELAEVKQSVSNGKNLIASAITDKGISTSSTDTFQTMADNIGLIKIKNEIDLPSWYIDKIINAYDVPSSKYGATASAINNCIYFIGGSTSTSKSKSNLEYNIDGNTWSIKTDMPTSRDFLSSTEVNNFIYCIGGADASYLNTNECYDPSTNTWTTKKSMSESLSYLTSSTIGNNIYVVGGRNDTTFYWGSNYCYDTLTNTWSNKTSLPSGSGRSGHSSVVIDNKMYIIGGLTSSGVSNSIERYDVNTDSWSTIYNMSVSLQLLSTESYGDKIYIIGGIDSRDSYTYSIYSYDIVKNEWNKLYDLNEPKARASSCIVGSVIYIMGGTINTNNEISNKNLFFIAK